MPTRRIVDSVKKTVSTIDHATEFSPETFLQLKRLNMSKIDQIRLKMAEIDFSQIGSKSSPNQWIVRKVGWARRDLNPGPRDYESPALTAELQARVICTSPNPWLNGSSVVGVAISTPLPRTLAR